MLKCFFALFALSIAASAAGREKPLDEPMTVTFNGNWAPFNMLDEQGQLLGIKIDYAKLILQKAQIKYRLKKQPTWHQVLVDLENNNADFTIGGANAANTNFKNLQFSKPLASFPLALAVNNNTPFVADFSFLDGKTLAVGENNTARLFLETNYPSINLVAVKDTYEALELLAVGEIDGVVDILPVLSHRMMTRGFNNLKIGGISSFEVVLSVAINKRLTHLLPKINWAIDSITAVEKQEILKKWLFNEPEDLTSEHLLVAVIVSLVVLVLISVYLIVLKSVNRKLAVVANTDQLTKAYNRNYLKKIITKQNRLQLKYGQKCGLIFFDIDNFKRINDTQGHDVGDELLTDLAVLLKGTIRKTDALIRWGGEEFLIVCPNTGLVGMQKLSKKIESLLLSHKFCCAGTISVSGAYAELDATLAIGEQYKDLDDTLYHVKRTGKGRIIKSKRFEHEN